MYDAHKRILFMHLKNLISVHYVCKSLYVNVDIKCTYSVAIKYLHSSYNSNLRLYYRY